MSEVTLSAAVRQSVTQLNRVQDQIDDTQQNLSTGKDVNSALDDPQNFFAAKSLNNRSDNLLNLKDQMGQGISTIESANEAASSIDNLLGQAEGIANSALNNLGTGEDAANERANLASDFNEIKSQIDKLAEDAGYQGKNLAIGDGQSFGGTKDSLRELNNVTGINSADVTNAKSVESTRVAVTGAGEISANQADQANAEKDRGLSNLRISGLQSKAKGNLDNISIQVEGGQGSDKEITVTEGNQSQTLNFSRETLKAREESGFVKFDSGTAVSFDVNLDKLENRTDNAGVGTSTIEKDVNLAVTGRDSNGLVQERAADNKAGESKLDAGENALKMSNSTVRFNVQEDDLQKGSDYNDTISESFGSRADAITDIQEGTNYSYSGDTTYRLSVAPEGDFNTETGNYDSYAVTLNYTDDSGSEVTVSKSGIGPDDAADTITFAGAGADGSTGTLEIDFNYDRLNALVESSAASATEVSNTFESQSQIQTGGNGFQTVTNNSVSGFVKNTVTDLTFEVTVNSENASGDITDAQILVNDGLDGIEAKTFDPSTNQSLDFKIPNGPNEGAEIGIQLDNLNATTSLSEGDTATFDLSVRGQQTSPGQTQFTTREGASDDVNNSAFVNTELKTPATSENDLRVEFNEDRDNFLSVKSQNLQTNGTGLQLDEAQNQWFDRADIEQSLDEIRSAKSKVNSAQATFSTNLNIVQTREEFTENFTNNLEEGADKLTLADETEEAAKLTTLQTRQQLGTTGLSIANQSQQAVLSLF